METYVRVSWKRMEISGLYKLLARLHKTRTTKHKHGSGRTWTVRNEWHNQHQPCVVAKDKTFLTPNVTMLNRTV